MTEPEKKIAITAPVQPIQLTFEPFDKNAIKWSRWVKRVETALDIFGCNTAKRRMYLLHYMGSQTYNILCDKLAPIDPAEITYDEITRILGEHFEPKLNEILEIYREIGTKR